jgi:hypothetical protein
MLVCDRTRASAGPAHADQSIHHFGVGRNGGVNPLRLSARGGVECTEDDTCVVCRSVLMKAEKVAIVRQQNPTLSRREPRTSASGTAEFAFPASNR